MDNTDGKTSNLLVTKLEVPQIKRRIVSRQRLTKMLDEGVKQSLTLVVAPTGYGKTTLLVDWVLNGAYSDHPIAWVNLDQYCDSALRFWAYVVGGIKKTIPNLRYNLEDYIQRDYNEKNFLILNPLLNEISSYQEQIILILDDFHTISDKVIAEGLMYLIDHKPANLHLVISGRKMPDLPLFRLIAQGQLLQITQENLIFTHNEVESFLKQIMQLDVTQEQITHMMETSEGWIAGIQLAGLSYHSWSELDLVRNQMVKDHRQIYAYLTQEVLNAQDESLRDFLLKTSILNELSAPLCDYVLQQSNSQDLLDQVEQANLFLVCLDYPGCAYRYHSLFAETLQEHLARTYPELVPELHRRACAWMLEQNMPGKAISHALAAGDLERAAEILDQYAIPALKTHDIFNLAKWIAHFTEDLYIKYPQLGIYKAFVNYHLGRIELTRQDLRQVRELLKSPDGKQFEAQEKKLIRWEHDALEAVLHTTNKDFSEAIESIHSLLENPPQADPFFITFLQHNLALTYEIVGDLSAASSYFLKGYENALSQKNLLSQLRSMLEVSRLEKVQGDITASEKSLNQCYRICRDNQLDDSYVVLIEAALLDKKLERCEMGAASRLVNHVLDVLEDMIDNPRLWLSLDLIYSKVVEYFLAVEDQGELAKNFNQMLKYTPSIRGDLPDMPWNLIDVQVRGWLALEQDSRSVIKLNEIRTFIESKRGKRIEEQIALYRIYLAQGDLKEAQLNLEQLVNQLSSTQFGEFWLQALILMALVYWQQGMESSAFQAIDVALTYGFSRGYQNIFIREGAAMQELLEHYLAAHTQEEDQSSLKKYIQRLLNLIENIYWSEQNSISKDGSPAAGQAAQEEEILTVREIEVLQLLNDGSAYKEIALQLNISVNTVKSHVKHIYTKLDVNTRKEMYSLARELKLID